MTSPDSHPLDLATRVQRSSQQVHCQVGDLIVLMKTEGGDYFELNRVGTRIWRELETPSSIAALVERILPDFDVDQQTCETQVLQWMDKMRGLGFVEAIEMP
jgi:hypothetical protein